MLCNGISLRELILIHMKDVSLKDIKRCVFMHIGRKPALKRLGKLLREEGCSSEEERKRVDTLC